jgi:hypothetical protein
MSTDRPTDRDPAEGGDVGPPAADTADDLVASEGVNETAAEDSPGASITGSGDPDEADAEPNEPG